MIGRAGTGVDNVDIEAATKRGIIVANAPESNSIAAAEHTMALILALSPRRSPGARIAAAGKWDRSRFKGSSSTARRSASSASAASASSSPAGAGLRHGGRRLRQVRAAERFRELGVESAASTDELYERADIITLHLPKTPETVNWVDAGAIERMRDGVRIVNAARGELIDFDALVAGLESGKVGGAALDVFPEEPFTDHPISAATTSSSPRTSAPRPPRRRTAPESSPPSRSRPP